MMTVDFFFNGTNETTTLHHCESLYDGKLYLTDTYKLILIIFNVTIMGLNVIVNGAVIYILLRRKLLKNPSMRLIFYLSLSDCCVALFAQPIFAVMLIDFSTSESCMFDTIAQFIIVTLIHISGYIIVIVGFDRYCRLRYLNRYSEIIDSCKINLFVAIAICLSLLHGVLSVVGTLMDTFEIINFVSVGIDLCTLLFTFTLYICSMSTMKRHRRNSVHKKMLKNTNAKVNSMSSRILIALFIFYAPYIIFALMHHWLIDTSSGASRENFNFALFIGYQLICVNSTANGFIFLSLNKESRTKCDKILKRFTHSPKSCSRNELCALAVTHIETNWNGVKM